MHVEGTATPGKACDAGALRAGARGEAGGCAEGDPGLLLLARRVRHLQGLPVLAKYILPVIGSPGVCGLAYPLPSTYLLGFLCKE